MSLQDTVADIARKHGVDEVIVVYTSKLELREYVAERARWAQTVSRQPLTLERARTLLREYGSCALVVGKDGAKFREALQAIEKDMHAKGFYRAWAVINEPVGSATMPSMEWFGIDIVATLKKYKKNLHVPVPGDFPPWAILLVE